MSKRGYQNNYTGRAGEVGVGALKVTYDYRRICVNNRPDGDQVEKIY
jgi:hypothetical protein